jgi:putative glutamine amidotransferase
MAWRRADRARNLYTDAVKIAVANRHHPAVQLPEEPLMRPVIGITPSPVRDEQPHGVFVRYAMATTYVNAVLAVGALPIVLPPQDGDVTQLLDLVDGLLLSGGADVEPAQYGDETVHPATYGVNPLRDRFEFALLDEAFRRDTPVLCICRGIQVLNVKLGGTLYQDIADQVATQTEHRQEKREIAKEEPSHRVKPRPGSLLADLYGADPIGVNSFHHQAIKALSPELEVVGHSDDGLIEAVCLPGRRFVLGLQWHPEMMFERHAEQLAPFAALVATARSRRLSTALA